MKNLLAVLMVMVVFLLISVIGGALIYDKALDFKSEANKLIKECEKPLPRTRHCRIEMVAVPIPVDKYVPITK